MIRKILLSALMLHCLCSEAAPLTPAQARASLGAPALGAAIGAFDREPMGHPRLLRGQDDYLGIVAAAKSERSRGMAALADYLKRHTVRNVKPALLAQIGARDQAQRMASWWQQDRMLEGIAEAAFVWHVTRDRWFLDEMRARMQLFGPAVLERGCSGDLAETREYVWYFALGYDFAAAAMSREERQLVRDVVRSCAPGLARAPAILRLHPDNGIAFNALGKFAGAMLILRGDMPDAAQWLDAVLPAYVAALSPWGGDDGGFANGSSYALWDAGESLLAWDLIERVLGVPLYRKGWVARLPRYIAYTLPPGTPAGAFGDGAEVKRGEEWARLGKALAYRSDTPLAAWYANALQGEDPARLHVLLSPRARPGGLPHGTPDSAWFPSVGVAAMHSALDDSRRTSVLFRASPFGAVNHAHADQNSFVLYAKGEVLAMDSGAYDAYNSPHWRAWYKQTKAHNAVTYDGGQGQALGPVGQGQRGARGSITRFADRGSYVLAVGEAARAYGGDVTQARRTVVLVRPSTLVVVDQLSAASARKWEWNLHTPAPLEGAAEDFKTFSGKVALCGSVAAGTPLALSSTQGYPNAPATPAGPHQWHRFALETPARQALFVAVLRADCTGAAPRIDLEAGGATIKAGGMTFQVNKTGVSG